MPLNTRPPALPSVQTGMTYQDYLKKYMEQMGVSSQPYNVAAPQVAPQSPMQVNPADIAKSVAKGAMAREGGSQLASSAAENELWNQGANSAYEAQQVGWNAGADAATNAAAEQAAPTILGNAASMGPGPLAAIAATTALAGKSGYDMLKGKRDSSPLGLYGRGSLAVATGGLSEVANRLLNGTKSQDQQGRDSIRSLLQGSGIADDKYMVNGFDIGKDGGARLQNVGTNISGKTDRGYYDVDFSNPLASKSIEGLRGIASATLGEKASEKQTNDLIGMLSNAALSNAKDEAGLNSNLANMYKAAGLTFGTPAAAAQTARAAIPRSSTLSPGIRKDGTRIDYSKKRK